MPLELIHFECSNSTLFLKIIKVYVMSYAFVICDVVCFFLETFKEILIKILICTTTTL